MQRSEPAELDAEHRQRKRRRAPEASQGLGQHAASGTLVSHGSDLVPLQASLPLSKRVRSNGDSATQKRGGEANPSEGQAPPASRKRTRHATEPAAAQPDVGGLGSAQSTEAMPMRAVQDRLRGPPQLDAAADRQQENCKSDSPQPRKRQRQQHQRQQQGGDNSSSRGSGEQGQGHTDADSAGTGTDTEPPASKRAGRQSSSVQRRSVGVQQRHQPQRTAATAKHTAHVDATDDTDNSDTDTNTDTNTNAVNAGRRRGKNQSSVGVQRRDGGFAAFIHLNPAEQARLSLSRRFFVGQGFLTHEDAARAHDRALLALFGAGSGRKLNQPLESYPPEERVQRTGMALSQYLRQIKDERTAVLKAKGPPPKRSTHKFARCGVCASCLKPWQKQACLTNKQARQEAKQQAAQGAAAAGDGVAGEQAAQALEGPSQQQQQPALLQQQPQVVQQPLELELNSSQPQPHRSQQQPPPSQLQPEQSEAVQPRHRQPDRVLRKAASQLEELLQTRHRRELAQQNPLPPAALLSGTHEHSSRLMLPQEGGELLEAAKLAAAHGSGRVHLKQQQPVLTCHVCQSADHTRANCPALQRLVAAPAAGAGGDVAGGSNGAATAAGEAEAAPLQHVAVNADNRGATPVADEDGAAAGWLSQLGSGEGSTRALVEALRHTADELLLPQLTQAYAQRHSARPRQGCANRRGMPKLPATSFLAVAVVLEELARAAGAPKQRRDPASSVD